MHFTLVRGRGVTDHFVTGANGGCERRGVVSKMHFALVRGRGVMDHFVTGTNGGSEHRGVISEMHFARFVVAASQIALSPTLILVMDVSVAISCHQSLVDCVSSLKGVKRLATKQKPYPLR